MRAVLDTNILIDHLKGVAGAQAEIARYDSPMISIVTWIEVLVGVRGEEQERSVRGFLDGFDVRPVSAGVSELAIAIRRDWRLRLPDALIWATAQEHQTLFVTRNVRDFPVDDPFVRVPYRLDRRS